MAAPPSSPVQPWHDDDDEAEYPTSVAPNSATAAASPATSGADADANPPADKSGAESDTEPQPSKKKKKKTKEKIRKAKNVNDDGNVEIALNKRSKNKRLQHINADDTGETELDPRASNLAEQEADELAKHADFEASEGSSGSEDDNMRHAISRIENDQEERELKRLARRYTGGTDEEETYGVPTTQKKRGANKVIHSHSSKVGAAATAAAAGASGVPSKKRKSSPPADPGSDDDGSGDGNSTSSSSSSDSSDTDEDQNESEEERARKLKRKEKKKARKKAKRAAKKEKKKEKKKLKQLQRLKDKERENDSEAEGNAASTTPVLQVAKRRRLKKNVDSDADDAPAAAAHKSRPSPASAADLQAQMRAKKKSLFAGSQENTQVQDEDTDMQDNEESKSAEEDEDEDDDDENDDEGMDENDGVRVIDDDGENPISTLFGGETLTDRSSLIFNEPLGTRVNDMLTKVVDPRDPCMPTVQEIIDMMKEIKSYWYMLDTQKDVDINEKVQSELYGGPFSSTETNITERVDKWKAHYVMTITRFATLTNMVFGGTENDDGTLRKAVPHFIKAIEKRVEGTYDLKLGQLRVHKDRMNLMDSNHAGNPLGEDDDLEYQPFLNTLVSKNELEKQEAHVQFLLHCEEQAESEHLRRSGDDFYEPIRRESDGAMQNVIQKEMYDP